MVGSAVEAMADNDVGNIVEAMEVVSSATKEETFMEV